MLAQHCDLVGLPAYDISQFRPALRAGLPPEAASALAAAALGMVQDGTYAAIQDTYFGEALPACNTGANAADVAVTFDQVRAGPGCLGASTVQQALLLCVLRSSRQCNMSQGALDRLLLPLSNDWAA